MSKAQSAVQQCNGSKGESFNDSRSILSFCFAGRIRSQVYLTFFSGSLTNVRQIGIEFHSVPKYITEYFTITQELYKLGFITIMWDENRWGGMKYGSGSYFEILFRRHNLDQCEDWQGIAIV